MSDFCFYRQELPSGGNVLFFKYVPGPPRLLKESYRLRRLLPAPETVREVRVIASKEDRARALEQLARVWLPLCTPAAGPRPIKRGFQCAACWQAWSLKKKIYRVQAVGKEPFIKPATSGAISQKITNILREIKKFIENHGKEIFMSPITLINFFFKRVWSKSKLQSLQEQRGALVTLLPQKTANRSQEISNAARATVKMAIDAENDEKKWQELTDEAIKLADKYKYRLYISISIHIIIFLDLVFLQKEQGMSLFPRAYKLIYYLASTLVFLIAKMFS